MCGLGSEWQGILLIIIFFMMAPLVIMKIKESLESYKKIALANYKAFQDSHNELRTQEGMIYHKQLKHDEKLKKILGLYEITKDMSTRLHFEDVFKVLAEYLEKSFMFKKARLILIRNEGQSSLVYECCGTKDNLLKAKGIIFKVEVSKRRLSGHDEKIYNLLKEDVRRLEIVESGWKENPYIQYLPEGAKTYVAVPMVIKNQIMGVIAIEDLPTSDFGKFSIVAAQFAMEMERIILYEKVEEMALTDGLTKAFAKRHIMERINEEFERSVRHKLSLTFLMIDIDYFKKCNDTYGHLVGDVVLKEIVVALKKNTREVDLVGRFGGEEFCIVLPETKKEEACLVAERIREVVEKQKIKAYDETANVTLSIGIAVYPDAATDVSTLIENSDKALYQAKHAGRNRISVFS